MNEEIQNEGDAYLTRQLLSLRPAELPVELRLRMSHPPARDRHRPARVWLPLSLAAAAAAAIGVFLAVFASDVSVSVSRRDSTLLGSTPLAVVERDGRLWEVVEQRWRDEVSLLSTATPVVVHHLADRREIVARPVHFD